MRNPGNDTSIEGRFLSCYEGEEIFGVDIYFKTAVLELMIGAWNRSDVRLWWREKCDFAARGS